MPTMQLVGAALFSLIGVLLPGCKESPPLAPPRSEIPEHSDGLIPLMNGNRWVIQYLQYDSSGSLMATFVDTIEVKRDTVIGSERWYNAPRLKPPDADYLDFYTNRPDGFWVRRRVVTPNQDTALHYMTFKYPTQAGESWGTPLGDSARTISTNELVTTPAGSDTCIKYEDHLQLRATERVVFHYYVRPGKGWVQLDIFLESGSGRQYLVNRLILLRALLNTHAQGTRRSCAGPDL